MHSKKGGKKNFAKETSASKGGYVSEVVSILDHLQSNERNDVYKATELCYVISFDIHYPWT